MDSNRKAFDAHMAKHTPEELAAFRREWCEDIWQASRQQMAGEAVRACEERARSYREARAPGWFEVDHECAQCAAAIRALAKD